MRFVRTLVIALVAVGLGACAAQPTPYAPAANLKSYGYADEQLDNVTWRVQFAGNRQTARGTVQDYLLYRSAEITVGQGYQGFVLIEDDVEQNVYYRGTTTYPSVFVGSGYGYPGYRGGGVAYGGGFGTTSLDPQNAYTAYGRIRLFNDFAPEGLGEAFDANAILRVLGPKIRRPVPTG